MIKADVGFFRFKLPVYNATIWVFISKSLYKSVELARDKSSETIIKDEDIKNTAAYTFSYKTETGGQRYMLFLKPNSKPGEIAHEAKHLINQLFSWHNYKLSVTNDEFECYYLELVVDKIHHFINKFKKGKKG